MKSAEDKVIARVKKLINLANGNAAGGEHERETAMKMALNILAKHNLSMADLGQEEMEARINEDIFHYTCPWLRVVANAMAELFFCKFFYTKVPGKQKYRFTFVGLESNVQTAKGMTNYVIKSIRKGGAQVLKDIGPSAETSFVNAAAKTVSYRCQVLRQEAEAESAAKPTGTSLVLASLYEQELKSNEQYIESQMGINLKAGRASLSNKNAQGARLGHEYGNNINLNRQITGNQSGEQPQLLALK